MPNSSSGPSFRKPRHDFPLFPHATGRWAKKVRGKLCYFGKCADDPDGVAALELWLDTKDELLAGRKPRAKGEGLTVRDLCNRFLAAKEQARDSQEITPRTWSEYKLCTDRLIEQFGRNRLVSDLRSEDLEGLRSSFAKTRAAVAIGNEIQRTRVVFKYAYDAGMIEAPMRFGPMFKRPTKKSIRIAKAKQGEKLFTATEILALLNAAGPQLKAMILLAVNAGFGNSDCGKLPIKAINLETGWINFPRPKTGIERRCPLWPETIAAIRDVLAIRKPPKDAAHAELLFVTKQGGSFSKDTPDNPVSKEFAKLRAAATIESDCSFYHLRHTFRTIADGTRDQVAANHIMGHADDSMAATYRERIADERLIAVVDHVHAWLYPPKEKPKPTSKPKAAKKPTKGKSEPTANNESPKLRIFG